MYEYNHKMWHLTACKISVSLSFLNWVKNEMLPTLIQRYDKKIISFLIQFKNERPTEILQVSDVTFYDRMYTIYHF